MTEIIIFVLGVVPGMYLPVEIHEKPSQEQQVEAIKCVGKEMGFIIRDDSVACTEAGEIVITDKYKAIRYE